MTLAVSLGFHLSTVGSVADINASDTLLLQVHHQLLKTRIMCPPTHKCPVAAVALGRTSAWPGPASNLLPFSCGRPVPVTL